MRTRNFLVVAVVAAFAAFAPSANAASGTFNCADLQDGLDQATHGDTITLDGVCDGGYELPSFLSTDDYFPSITLTGTPGSGFDMEGEGRALTGVDTHRFEITNLKFENGAVDSTSDQGANGGAINVIGDSSLVVRDSVFENNHADGNGGAIYDGQTDSPGLDLGGFAFTGNIFGSETNPDLGNTAGGNGGALSIETSHNNGNSAVVSNNFFNNEADGDGGAYDIKLIDRTVVGRVQIAAAPAENISLNDNLVKSNSAEGSGGGGHIVIANSTILRLDNERYEDNTVEELTNEPSCDDHFGGGVFIETGTSPIVQRNNVFSGNEIENIDCGGDYGGGGEAIRGDGASVRSEVDAFLLNTVAGQENIGTISEKPVGALDDSQENESEGGGLYLSGTDAKYHGWLNRVAGNAIGNGDEGHGAGAYAGASLPTNEATLEFSDSTIAGNIIGFGGELPGLAGSGNDNLVLHNSIVWNPTQQFQPVLSAAGTLNQPDIGGFDSTEVLYTDACRQEEVVADDATQAFPGDGNQCVDPLLQDAQQGDIHQTSKSPTIDKGNDDLFFQEEESPCCDFEGDPRPTDGDGDGHTADQGADESPAFVVPPTTGQQTPPKPQCSDGIDNDGDGTVDSKDPGCLSGPNDTYNPADNNESDETLNELVLCGRRNISLVRATTKKDRVSLSGLVATRFGGKKVKVFQNLGNGWSQIATKKAKKNGVFKLKVAGPSADNFNKVRYQARIAGSRSANLKLPQSLTSLSVKQKGKNIVIKGKVKKSLLGSNPHAVTIRRLVCGHYLTVGKAKPDSNGNYTLKFKAPRLGTAALYRAETRVLARATSKKYVKQYARAIGIKLTNQTG